MAFTFEHPSFTIIFLFLSLAPLSLSNPTLSDDSDDPMTFIIHMAKQHYSSPLTVTGTNPSSNPFLILITLQGSCCKHMRKLPVALLLWNLACAAHRSFSDEGLSPIPTTWKGTCETSSDFPASSCNRKIIGARAFLKRYYVSNLVTSTSNLSTSTNSPRDIRGHGTHTASTAAGSMVSNASFYKYANGEAIGVATKARIAVYKVCAVKSCKSSDMLAGFDQAIADGVDIISMSISGGNKPYHRDNLAIATFGAMQHGILVSVSAGNKGPARSTVNHLPPWVLTTGASSIDREFRADVVLGDNRTFLGASLYPGPFFPFTDRYKLVYARNFGNTFCKIGSFRNQNQLAGKIVVCNQGDVTGINMAFRVYNVSGHGTIIGNNKKFGEELRAEQHLNPATRVGMTDGDEIIRYILSSENPTANILFRGTVINGSTSPPASKVATSSSHGPNPITPQILKPDVIAPGLNILGAWTGATGPRGDSDPRRVEFNIISGTSMACPHVSGITALLKKVHPTWSSAAIKSALTTTAYNVDNTRQRLTDLATGKKSTPFAHGSGHVDPNRALDPGLVYDMGVTDYVGFLCSIGMTPGDLNLPSFSLVFSKEVETVTYKRSVTNVGTNVDAVYTATGAKLKGVKITVSPKKLVFNANNLTQTYEITFSSIGGYGKKARSGWIRWSDGTHRVKSTIVFSWAKTTIDYM
ncbi:hypothetical protein TIFTF001_037680 [Ficus carica]|uniref:Uncharacterized protein n=1 Tax=Ficus carica TaxID=3494 RepID=A0AA88E5R8_FICCA|nr:hypothetical protein TIFTF001_037680 [Ficus carica]